MEFSPAQLKKPGCFLVGTLFFAFYVADFNRYIICARMDTKTEESINEPSF
jgi:hypothetical protein